MDSIFLDRDGVINEDKGYVHLWEDFHFIDGSIEALKILTQKKVKIIIITNQSGIARGYFSESQFNSLVARFNQVCLESGIKILDTFYCPHYPDAIIEKYKIFCNCRKPNPGMILEAFEKYELSPDNSYLVGDRPSDLIAGHRSGIKNLILLQNEPKDERALQKIQFKIKKSLYHFVTELEI